MTKRPHQSVLILVRGFMPPVILRNMNFTTVVMSVVLVGSVFGGCSKAQMKPKPEPESKPDIHIDLSSYGLPSGFFRAGTDSTCASQIIGYRFVVWLSNENVSVGFNTSPNCRQSPDRKVNGSARVLVFNLQGALKASRDLPYLADGNGELVAEGEGRPGPDGALLFRIESVNIDSEHESKSGLLLLDANLKDVAHIDRFLEQTTFVDHALVFQEGVTLSGPRTYSVMDGRPPKETQRWQQDWPTGTMDRRFGEHEIAFMHCLQQLRPNEYASSNVVYMGAKRHCTVNIETSDQTGWKLPLKEDDTAAIVGLLADGSVVGQINIKDSNAGRLVIWKKDLTTETLPWISPNFSGTVQSATANMSRYGTFATDDSEKCKNPGKTCSDKGRWIIFDRRSQAPIEDRLFPKNGRAALSPDGLRYASFESGELRIYSLPKSE
jgi:hypothetical protein